MKFGELTPAGKIARLQRGTARRRMRSPAMLALLLALVIGGCGGRKAKEGTTGVPPRGSFHMYNASREIVDSIRIDLNGDGRPEFVVTSRDRAADTSGGRRQFDRVEVFSIDPSAQEFSSMFVDPVVSGTRVAFRELTRTRGMQVLVDTDGGGNDPVSSKGLNIYGYRNDGRFTVVFFSEGGMPEMRDLDNDGVAEVLQTGEYWGMGTHAEAITYTEAVYAFDGFAYIESNVAFPKYFDREIATRKNAYAKARSHRRAEDEASSVALYRACAAWLVWIAAKQDTAQLRRVWEGEKAFLRTAIDRSRYEDLDDFVQTVLEEDRTRNEQERNLS